MYPLFLDTETTGVSKESRLCQIAYKSYTGSHCFLFRPPHPIPEEASKIHGITDFMVKDRPLFKDSPEYAAVKATLLSGEFAMVAHNAPFDVGMLQREDINPPHVIDTLRLARHWTATRGMVWTSYSLQALRAEFHIEVEAKAHDALGDITVLEKLWEVVFAPAYKIEEALKLTSGPLPFTHMPFGKHKGRPMQDVPKDYLRWLSGQANIQDDLRVTLELHLK